MFKTRGGAGGQRPFEQCSKKQTKWYPGASLRNPKDEKKAEAEGGDDNEDNDDDNNPYDDDDAR